MSRLCGKLRPHVQHRIWGPFIGIILVIAVICGLISGGIASSKGLPAGGYFFLGLVLGVIGIIIAAVVRPATRPTAYAPPPSPPGWYVDPWGQQRLRYWDGYQWTWHNPDAS